MVWDSKSLVTCAVVKSNLGSPVNIKTPEERTQVRLNVFVLKQFQNSE